jgi:hypothetical protein
MTLEEIYQIEDGYVQSCAISDIIDDYIYAKDYESLNTFLHNCDPSRLSETAIQSAILFSRFSPQVLSHRDDFILRCERAYREVYSWPESRISNVVDRLRPYFKMRFLGYTYAKTT